MAQVFIEPKPIKLTNTGYMYLRIPQWWVREKIRAHGEQWRKGWMFFSDLVLWVPYGLSMEDMIWLRDRFAQFVEEVKANCFRGRPVPFSMKGAKALTTLGLSRYADKVMSANTKCAKADAKKARELRRRMGLY
ncbi:MAG: hypothetical protein DRJ18_00635 [Candidatus Methanomethylicota archaeon]|nr:MAG: hypothetical protein DRJ18_00635 [Candidatus Verstraetearchaeota archaeon]